ncbi:MAG: putative addiction module antidote protein [Hyphomicrobium sp.]|jgi:probable addiction module antidote protein|uniref:addiction module antidote protein n=1 Tax=Hyphomicrobium sp. TaxID=82 RepID=UPI0025BB1852|nr:addiction module antidote protein [Hyphomicrobium sp.]MBX9864648.1 putative addiction module antidote protein [Hyphomicrobium sp.]
MAKSRPFDASEYLENESEVAAYIAEAMLTQDVEHIAHAIGVAAKVRGMTQIAERTGLSRESLYRALSAGGSPKFDTIQRVLEALDLQLTVQPSKRVA